MEEPRGREIKVLITTADGLVELNNLPMIEEYGPFP